MVAHQRCDRRPSSEVVIQSLAGMMSRGAAARRNPSSPSSPDSPGVSTGAGRECRGPLPCASLEQALGAGWLVAADGGYRLTPKGRSVLRRKGKAGAQLRIAVPPAGSTTAPDRTPASNAAESPLSWLRHRLDKDGNPMLSAEQFEAGERLRRDLWQARMTPRVTAGWSGIPRGSRRVRRGAPGAFIDVCDQVMAARERATRALIAAGSEHIDLLIDVLGHLKGLEEIERTASLPPRSAKRFLQRALTLLARHYGLLPPLDVESHVRTRLRHWGSEDYRPMLDPPA